MRPIPHRYASVCVRVSVTWVCHVQIIVTVVLLIAENLWLKRLTKTEEKMSAMPYIMFDIFFVFVTRSNRMGEQ